MPVYVWVLVVLVWVIGPLGAWIAIRRERRDPSSYPRTAQCEMDRWRALSTAEQARRDAEELAKADAAESAAAVMAELYRRPAPRP
ncbi:hypothetical protein G6W51_33215 [Streptomyces coelicolor]|nr:hypothetical protein [Streptomyces coelicolor]